MGWEGQGEREGERNGGFFLIDINTMPHHTVILHALQNLSFSFTITFTVNNHKTIDEIHYIFYRVIEKDGRDLKPL